MRGGEPEQRRDLGGVVGSATGAGQAGGQVGRLVEPIGLAIDRRRSGARSAGHGCTDLVEHRDESRRVNRRGIDRGGVGLNGHAGIYRCAGGTRSAHADIAAGRPPLVRSRHCRRAASSRSWQRSWEAAHDDRRSSRPPSRRRSSAAPTMAPDPEPRPRARPPGPTRDHCRRAPWADAERRHRDRGPHDRAAHDDCDRARGRSIGRAST